MDFSAFLGFDRAVFEWVERIFDYGISGVLTPILVFLTRLGDGGILWIALALAVLSCIDYIVRNKDVIDTTNI